ncbi:protein kinase, partial [bacterium]|nr:protein kinase [bacterium]
MERFKREARSLARLAHPSIVRVYDYGVQEGCPFLTMDFVAGTTLESILRGGGLPIERGLVILEEVAEAVDHAHSRGVVHRDLKPANVLIGADGRARITDFGLAKILDEGASLTRSGDLIGTPLYMSPEQVSGDLSALGPSSDVWSLGVTLYLLLTGEQPFGAKTIDEVSKKVLHEEPVPPRKLRPEISEELEKVCAAALAKDPKRRYQSAGELSRDLSNYLHGKPVLAGRVTTGVRARRFARAVQLRLGLRAVLLFLLVFVASASLTMLLLAPTHGGTTDVLSPRLKAQLARLQDVVRVLGESPPEPASAEEARLNLLSAHKAVRDAIDPGEGQALSVCDALLAKGHALLAEHPRDPAREDEWAARELLAAADCAPDAVPGTGASRALMDKLTALARALDPLERTHDSSLRKHAKKVLGAIGETAAGPLVSGRVHLLAGDFEEAERLLTLALERTKGSPGSSEREQAGLASIDALLALELYEDARSRAQELEAEASSREASLERSTRLELCVVRAARQLRQADPRALELVSSYLDATSQGKPGSSRRREAL